MRLTFERASEITSTRNRAVIACDIEAFPRLWADHCIVEGPEHLLRGKAALRAAMEGAWSVAKPIDMVTRSLAAQENAIFYEFAIVSKIRETGERALLTGTTYHEVDDTGRLQICREYFDPPGRLRRSVADEPRFASLL